MNKVEKLRSIIRESINEYIKEIDSAGTTAMYEAKMKACDEAIEKRKKKIEMAESLEEMQGMFDESKIKDLKNEIKALDKQKAKYGKMLEKLNKGKEVVTEEPAEEAPVDEADITAEMTDDTMTEGKKKAKKTYKKEEKEAVNESFLKMQKLAGIITEADYRQKKLNENQARYFIVINNEGESDELGNMRGIFASTKEEFKQKFESDYSSSPEEVDFTFYEVPNSEAMNKIAKMSNDWYSGDESVETKLMNIAKSGKPFSQISF